MCVKIPLFHAQVIVTQFNREQMWNYYISPISDNIEQCYYLIRKVPSAMLNYLTVTSMLDKISRIRILYKNMLTRPLIPLQTLNICAKV